MSTEPVFDCVFIYNEIVAVHAEGKYSYQTSVLNTEVAATVCTVPTWTVYWARQAVPGLGWGRGKEVAATERNKPAG